MDNKRKNRNSSQSRTDTFSFEKLPPQARELEEAVVGACMLGGLKQIENILSPEMFLCRIS